MRRPAGSGTTAAWLIVALAVLLGLPAQASGGEGGPDMTHRMMLLTLQLGVIFLAAKIGGHVFRSYLKMPAASSPPAS